MQNNVNSSIFWYEGHTITSFGKILKFSKFYVQNIWHVVRWWKNMQMSELMMSSPLNFPFIQMYYPRGSLSIDSKLTHLHIQIDWSRNVLWKFAKIRFSLLCLKILLFLLKFKLYLFWVSPLTKMKKKNRKLIWPTNCETKWIMSTHFPECLGLLLIMNKLFI